MPYHLIIADDDPAIAGLLEELIRDAYPHAVVDVTNTGQRALTTYQAAGADLLLLDITMPVLMVYKGR